MSVPLKYREIGDFHEYYSGARKAPYLTIFVGGNHEASNHLWELYYGGWVAPKIYYLGAANVVRVGPLRIAGLSGIWKGYNYNKPHHERLPYNQDDVKSIYHVRELDVRKLLQVGTQVDVGISHDWPRGIEWMGNWKALFAKKDLFEADARAGTLGSSAAKYVMDHLRPPHWFAAHLHCKFPAVVKYGGRSDTTFKEGPGPERNGNLDVEPPGAKDIDEIDGSLDDTSPKHPTPARNEDEIDLDMDDEEPIKPPPAATLTATKQLPSQNKDEIDLDTDNEEPIEPSSTAAPSVTNQLSPLPPVSEIQPVPADIRAQLPASFAKPSAHSLTQSMPHPEAITNKTTRFLALDKCLPNRKFLQILDVDPISQPPPSASISDATFQLCYDKEWLAITRVFASDLVLGDPTFHVPANKGQAYYQPRIAAEAQWVEEHVEKRGFLTVPDNFEITAPVYDPSVGTGIRAQPREYTNLQTAAFCKLVGIENAFHATEEERDERMKRVPTSEDARTGEGGGRGGGRGRGGGGRDRGRGKGRGRGRGYR